MSTTTHTAECAVTYMVGTDGTTYVCDQPYGHDGLHAGPPSAPHPSWCTRPACHDPECGRVVGGVEFRVKPHAATIDSFENSAVSVAVELFAEELVGKPVDPPHIEIWVDRKPEGMTPEGGMTADQARELGDRLRTALHAAAARLEEVRQ